MAANIIGKMTLGKWIALAVVLAVIAFTLLTQFTSFQVPGSVTQGKPEPDCPSRHPASGLDGVPQQPR